MLGDTMERLTPKLTVNDVLRVEARAAAVFNRYGIDTCCGGSLTVEEASRAAGVPPERVILEILDAADGKGR